ncbi:MAG: outer membrane beta-barrel protein [Curvibacter sp.]
MKKAMIACAAAMTVSGAALAQTGFYVGVDVGAATVKDRAQELASALVDELGGSAAVTQDTGVGFARLHGGYQINRYVAAELGYLRTGEAAANFSGVSGGSVAYRGSAKLSLSGFDLSAVIKPFEQSGLDRLFFRVGMTSYETKLAVSATGGGAAAAGTAKESGTGTILGVGYDLPAGPGVVRFQLNTLQRISGVSDNSSTAFGAGYLWKF